MLLLLSFADTS